ncbi:hypothetical protein LZ554_005245 [Drepanopeziza brunnea f. sp. 'monogermtubi']|nr:hypothetical protein LZ554_005245 [Drepanopeziza brunnea f. sp. 'monogermtubi']
MDKEEYFRQLYSLNDSSDDEEDINDAWDCVRQSKPPLLQPVPTPAEPPSHLSRRRSAPLSTKAPGILRTTSAPVTSASVPKAPIVRKSSLLRYDISTQDIVYSPSEVIDLTSQATTPRPVPEKSVSTPNIGSVVMNNSKGIEAMLVAKSKKKRGRAAKAAVTKDPNGVSFKLMPEGKRFLDGIVIYYIPPDLKGGRDLRISKALGFGAKWTKEWTAEITHVVVENGTGYDHKFVMKHLSDKIISDVFPGGIALVTDEFLIVCFECRFAVDPKQKKFAVPGDPQRAIEEPKPLPEVSTCSQDPEDSLQLKQAKSRKGDHVSENTPSQSQRSAQGGLSQDQVSPAVRVSLIPDYAKELQLTETPKQSPDVAMKTGKRGDILDEFIDVARKLEYLPLDDDEDDDDGGSRPSTRDDPADSGGSEEERARSKYPSKKRKKYGNKGASHQDNFSCMKGGTGIALENNPNRQTIEILGEMGAYYERIRDQWRTLAYRKAVGTLKKQSVKITRYEQAIELQFIGHRLALKIEEIAITGHLRRLDNARLDPNDKILQLFLKIYGVGPGQADKWIQAGHKTLDDLRALPNLHKNQKIGLDHYDDFDTRIPRDQVTALGEIVKKAVDEIDPQVEAIIGGSYRRGALTSGDIDFIITKRGTESGLDLLPFLNKLVGRLSRDAFLVCALAVPHQSGSKWHGACVLPGNPIWHRIDFLIVPESEFGAALLYFTGDDIFNRSMRLLASKKGMRLNQRGLYRDVMRGPGRVKLNEGEFVEGADERRIFDVLGVPWRPPQERICH